MKRKAISVIILTLLLTSMLTLAFNVQPVSVRACLREESVQAKSVDWWPMFHHDLTHAGYSTSTVVNTTLTWHYLTGSAVVSSPAVVDGTVFVGSLDNNTYALNAKTGAQVWNYTTGGPIQWSSPAVASGVVYVGSTDNKIYALNAATGTEVWSYATAGEVWSSPAVAGGVVYVGSNDGNVYALSATTGTKVWNYTTAGAVWSSPAVVDGRVYVGSDDNKTYCLNASTGNHMWKYTTGGAVESSPAVADGVVYVGSNDGNIYFLNATTGTLVWSWPTGGGFSSPAVADGMLYVGSGGGNICAFGKGIDPYWSYCKEPAPMGIADYGIGPSGPYEYATKSFVGIVTIRSLLTDDGTYGRDHNALSFQLNVEFEFNTTCGPRVFWVQNVADVRSFGSGNILTLANYVLNLWNWSEPGAIMDPSGISGGGSFGKPQDPYGYVGTREGNFTPYNHTTPIAITLNTTSGMNPSGEPTVSLAYDFGNGLVTYDTVTFTNVTVTSTPVFKVNGFQYAPTNAFYEAALILGGFPTTTDILSDVQLQLEYWNGHNYQTVPNAYNFGSNTAETISNVISRFSHHSGNGEISAEILPGAGQLGELYNQFQTGVIDITSPLASGTLYVTNASDPNATAWQIPFVDGEAAVTLYPGCYDLQLYNQYGKLYDQGNFTVSAGQILHLQTPLRTYDVTIAAHCITEGKAASVTITEDGTPTGSNTPHTFKGLAGTHTFTVPGTDASGHSFKQWGTGETSTTITVSSGGTYTAYYRTPPVHDVAVTDIRPSKTVVGQSYSQNMTVIVLDPGDYPETCNVTTRADAVGINDGLVGYWSFDEGSGTTVYDSSGNHNDGTINGATWTGGQFGKALSFDGIDYNVTVPGSPSLNNISDAVTIAAWVKLEQIPTEAYELIAAGGYSYVAYAYVADPAGVRFNFARVTGPGVGDDLQQEFWKQYGATLPYLPYNQWYYVVWMYDSSGYTAIYVNGNPYANTTLMNGKMYSYGGSLTINARSLHKGIIDEVRIYNRTLSQQEIRAVAGSGAIQTQTVSLTSGASTTLTFTWSTIGFAYGNYSISAYAQPVPGETDTADNNTYIDGIVTVTIPGDVDGDFDVDLYDVVKICSVYGSKKGDPGYDVNLDINSDGKIDLYDVVIACTHYGEKYP